MCRMEAAYRSRKQVSLGVLLRGCAVLFLGSTVLNAQSHRPLVAVGGISHETNTFNPRKTSLADFELGVGAAGILRGGQIIAEMTKANGPISGFIEGAKEYGF